MGLHEERLAAYHATNNDEQAAKKLRITRNAFCVWRFHQGLPSKGHLAGKRQITPQENARRRAAYDANSTDAAAAAALGLRVTTYQTWRRTRGLPAKHSRPQAHVSKAEARRRIQAIAKAATLQDAADALDMDRRALTLWIHTNPHLVDKPRGHKQTLH